MSKRYFINNLDTTIGQEFYSELVKTEENEEIEGVHMATYKDDDRLDVPKGFKKILKRNKPKLSRKKMLEECDVYIYDLNFCAKSDIEYVCGIFGNPTLQLDEQKVLIVISNFMVWSANGKKEKKIEEVKLEEGEGEGGEQPNENQEEQNVVEAADPVLDQEQEQQPGQEDNQQSTIQKTQQSQFEEAPIPDPVYVPWEDKDYKERQANQKYEYLKEMEDMVLNLNKENLKVIVLCAGIWYGKGENLFKNHFKSAWLQDPFKLPCFSDGNNRIPTVHITDLIRMTLKVSESPPEQTYVFAIDKSPSRVQRDIIRGISVGVGSGKIEEGDATIQEQFYKQFTEDELDFLSLNLDLDASFIFVGNEENPSDYNWHCEMGLAENAKKVLEEFCKIHKLRPMKLCMYCPVLRSEMKFDQIMRKMQRYYRIPIIDIKGIFEYALNPENDFPTELLEDLKEEYPIMEQYIQNGVPQPMSETMKLFYFVVKWRLQRNDCANRGFILDNYPMHYQECEMIFYPNKQKLKRKKKPKKPVVVEESPAVSGDVSKIQKSQQDEGQEEVAIDDPVLDNQAEGEAEQPQEENEEKLEEEEVPEEEEQPEEEEEGGPKPEPFYPESVVLIKPLDRKNKESYNSSLLNFFSERNLEIQMLDSKKKTNYEIFQSLRLYQERNGRPFNYLQPEEQLVNHYFMKYQIKQGLRDEAKKNAFQTWKELSHQQGDHRIKIASKTLEYIQANEQELHKVKSFPFRNYLMEFVVPVLNEGLVEVSHILPDDPVEFLAEYLYKKSFEKE